ncbi:MAG: hypothetical protein AABM40_04705 [Chloroflexota bacterium]
MNLVAITTEGDVLIEGQPLASDRWRRGGTGSHVMRRYLGLLAAVYPRALARDHLTDMLWPQSDGDRAINNLYAATSDLRCILRGVAGVRLMCSEGAYGLSLQGNVGIMTVGSKDHSVAHAPGSMSGASTLSTSYDGGAAAEFSRRPMM